MANEQRPETEQPAKQQGEEDAQHLTRRGEAGERATLPRDETPNAASPVPDEYRRDPSDDGLPDSG